MSDRIVESKQSESLIKEIEKVSNLTEIPQNVSTSKKKRFLFTWMLIN